MMPSLSPALDASVNAACSPAVAMPAAEGTESHAFSSLIQGLQPFAASTSASLPGAGTALQAEPTSMAELALPASTEPLTSALASVLQALGLSESALTREDDIDTDLTGSTDSANADSITHAATILPTVPVLIPNALVMPATTALASAIASSSRPAEADLTLDTASGSPAQRQALQWLAALAPALAASDSTTPVLEAADTPPTLTQQPPGVQTPTAQAVPMASAMPAGNVWLQQPLASFFSMSASTDSSSVIRDHSGLTLDGLTLPTDTPKGMPSAMSFAQTLSSAGSSTSTSVLTTLLPHAVQDPAWSDAFGQRVALLAQQGTQSATLQLNPPELGPIQVRIAMSEQGARVEFNTSQQTTSDLIETAMPRLAAALEQQGLRLDDARVNLAISKQDAFNAQSAFSSARQDTPQGDRGQATPQHAQSSARLPSANAGPEEDSLLGTVIRLPVAQDNGIDYYA